MKQSDHEAEEGSEAAEFEAGMAGVDIVDGEDEAEPSARGETMELHDALKVCSSPELIFTCCQNHLRPHTLHAHVQTQIIKPSPVAALSHHTYTQIINQNHRRTMSPPPPPPKRPRILPRPFPPALSATSTTTTITPTTTPPHSTTLSTRRAPKLPPTRLGNPTTTPTISPPLKRAPLPPSIPPILVGIPPTTP